MRYDFNTGFWGWRWKWPMATIIRLQVHLNIDFRYRSLGLHCALQSRCCNGAHTAAATQIDKPFEKCYCEMNTSDWHQCKHTPNHPKKNPVFKCDFDSKCTKWYICWIFHVCVRVSAYMCVTTGWCWNIAKPGHACLCCRLSAFPVWCLFRSSIHVSAYVCVRHNPQFQYTLSNASTPNLHQCDGDAQHRQLCINRCAGNTTILRFAVKNNSLVVVLRTQLERSFPWWQNISFVTLVYCQFHIFIRWAYALPVHYYDCATKRYNANGLTHGFGNEILTYAKRNHVQLATHGMSTHKDRAKGKEKKKPIDRSQMTHKLYLIITLILLNDMFGWADFLQV